jgi:hypothetical protein
MESSRSKYRFGKVLIVANNEVAINTAQASRFIQKKGQYCCSFQNKESIITLKKVILYTA